MLSHTLENALQQLELGSATVSQALAVGDPTSLEQASTQLRAVLLAFAEFAGGLSAEERNNPQLLARLKQVGGLMATLRQSLARRSVAIDRALGVLVPSATRSSTYGDARRSAAGYAGLARQTGAFTVLAA